MADEDGKGFLASLAEGGLPQLMLGKYAAEAIGKIILGAADIPAALLKRPVRAIEDANEARSLVRRAVSNALAERAAANPALVDRMAMRWGLTELRRQENLEASTAETIEELKQDQGEQPRPVDDDFLDRWREQAARAGTEEMQKLFGRVLAGEIRKPGSFNYAALHIFSIMDADLAAQIQRAKTMALKGIGGLATGGPFNEGSRLLMRGRLADVGILRAMDVHFKTNMGSVGIFQLKDHVFTFDGESKKQTVLPFARLTDAGEQVMSVVPDVGITDDDLKAVLAALRKTGREFRAHRRISPMAFDPTPLQL